MWIERISLERFLLFDSLDLILDDGLNLVLAPNEGGKSSLMRGIMTALYRDASSRKQEIKESRQWGHDTYFSTGIDFHLRGDRYTVERDFEEKKQTIKRAEEQESHRRGKRVDEFLREHLPLPDEELFLRVCGVRQEELSYISSGKEEIGERLEEILGGGWGDVSPARVRKMVEEALAGLRKGLDRPVNPGNEGPLKRLEDEVEELERQLAEAKEIESKREELMKSLSMTAAKLDELQRDHDLLSGKRKKAKEYSELRKESEGVWERAEHLRRRKERLGELLTAKGEHDRKMDEFPRELRDLKDSEEVRFLAELEREQELAGKLEETDARAVPKRSRQFYVAGGILAIVGALGALVSSRWYLAFSLAGLAVLAYRIFVDWKGRTDPVRTALKQELEALQQARPAWAGEMTAADAEAMLMRCNESRREQRDIELKISETIRDLQSTGSYEEQLANLDGEYGEVSLEWRGIAAMMKELEPFKLDADALVDLERNIESLEGTIGDLGIEAETSAKELSLLGESGMQEIRERLAVCREALEREMKKGEVLVVIKETIESARSGISGLISEKLPLAAGRYLERITAGRYRDLLIDPINLSVKIRPAGGDVPDKIDPALLSQGTRDQIYFALRIGLVELLGGSEPLPLFLDDPFVHFDPDRKAQALDIIRTLAERHQVLLFTCDPGYREIGGRLITLT
jgi:DNA repair exonuclease SbcCD ATPase subunit